MKATVKKGNKKRLKTVKEAKRDVTKAARPKNYPVAETIQWVSEGEKLLRKWGAIKSPAAKRAADGVAMLLNMLSAVTEMQKR